MSDHHFYVQERRREPWHVESDEDCERMLCGLRISIESKGANISQIPGSRICADCWILLELQHKIEALGPHQLFRI
jgi:hypothetical protein